MTYVYGKDYQINIKNASVYEAIGGTVYEPTLDPNAEVVTEVGCGEGARTIAAQKLVSARPTLRWTMNIRRLADYITSKAMITAQGALPAHDLIVKIGTEYHILGSCKVNTCKLRVRQNESIKAELEVFAKTRTAGSTFTFASRADGAMWKNAVTTFTINTVAVTGWQEFDFGIDNKVVSEVLGTDILPTEVGEREALYTGRILRAVSGTTKIGDVLAGTEQDIVITLTDNQGTPVVVTFTFADCNIRSNPVRVRGLEMVFEEINWSGKGLVIS